MENPSELTIAEALGRYRLTITPQKKSAKTEQYRITNILRSPISQVKLAECTPFHIATHRDLRLLAPHPQKPAQTIGPATVKHEMMLLSHLFTIAEGEWGIEGLSNPVLKVRKPRVPPGRIRRLKPVEEAKIMRALKHHANKELKPLVILALETAARQGELLGLRWENISFKKRVAHLPVTKNGERRDIPLTLRSVETLKQLKPEAEGAVFRSNHGALKSAWRSMMAKLGIEDLHFHDLRHEAISRLFEAGLDAIEVSTISGHKSMQMLRRYAHLSSYKLVLKLDRLVKRQSRPEKTPKILDQLRPYPATLVSAYRFWTVEFPNFPDLLVKKRQLDDALDAASVSLLRHQLAMLRAGRKLPEPLEGFDIPPGRFAYASVLSILPM